MIKWTNGYIALCTYIHHSYFYRMCAYMESGYQEFSLDVYSDSDYAGCPETQRSTTGAIIFLRGNGNTSVPISFVSKRQGSVSRSTSEAEIVAMDSTIRLLALPALSFVEEIFSKVIVHVCGDNQAMLCVMKTGRNPTMRHLSRTHRVSIAWLHEQHHREQFTFK